MTMHLSRSIEPHRTEWILMYENFKSFGRLVNLKLKYDWEKNLKNNLTGIEIYSRNSLKRCGKGADFGDE